MYPPSFPLFCTRVHTEYARPFVLFFLSRHPLTSFSPEKDFAVHIFMWVASSAVSGLELLSRKKPSSVSGPHGRLGRRRIRDAHSLPPLALICCGYVQEQETHGPLFFSLLFLEGRRRKRVIRYGEIHGDNLGPSMVALAALEKYFEARLCPNQMCVWPTMCVAVSLSMKPACKATMRTPRPEAAAPRLPWEHPGGGKRKENITACCHTATTILTE